jgi:hypothetical protein
VNRHTPLTASHSKEYRSTIESVNQRWRELEQKGQELQGSVISYDKFLKVSGG